MIKTIKELEPGEFFVFISDQTTPYFRVYPGYISVASEGIFKNSMDARVATVDRLAVEKMLWRFDLYPGDLTRILKEAFEEFPTPEYWQRELYLFDCKECGEIKRKTYDIDIAAAGICRKCKYAPKPDPNQTNLFGEGIPE